MLTIVIAFEMAATHKLGSTWGMFNRCPNAVATRSVRIPATRVVRQLQER